MAGRAETRKTPAKAPDERSLETLSEAIESGAGLPAVARAAAAALGASVALIDRSSAVLAVAASSSAEEGKLLGASGDVATIELRVADAAVGELRYRSRGPEPSPTLIRMVSTLLALELERSRAPEWASDEAAGEFVRALLAREVTDRGDIVARAAELGSGLEGGAGVIFARAAPRAAQAGDWRARVLIVSLRALRSSAPGSIALLARGRRAGAGERGAPGRGAGAARARDRSARARARRVAARLPRHGVAQPLGGRPRRSLPRRPGGAAGGERGRGRRPRAARVRGHGLLPAAAAGDERGPGASSSASTRRPSRRSRPTTTSTRPTSSRRSRPTWPTTATSPRRPSSSSPTGTRSATGSSG